MVETVKCKALVAFTHFVSGYGMVHGDPDSTDKAATNPEVPVDEVAGFVTREQVKTPKGFLEDREDAAATEAAEVAEVEAQVREEDAAKADEVAAVAAEEAPPA